MGNRSVKVSPMYLGSMMLGERTDAAEAGCIVTSVLAGPRTCEQWTEYLVSAQWTEYLEDALEHGFSAEDGALVDAIVTSGHPSMPGFNGSRYPIAGRPTRS